ncbi:MAG: hypothetical protein IT524_06830 [Nitrosomonas sp.]|nr:hypothetical protein [Nitrosomonas sp.]
MFGQNRPNIRIHALKIKTLLSLTGCGRGFDSWVGNSTRVRSRSTINKTTNVFPAKMFYGQGIQQISAPAIKG